MVEGETNCEKDHTGKRKMDSKRLLRQDKQKKQRCEKKNFHIIERINMEMKREMKNARRLACDAIEAANEMSRREGNNIDAKARCIQRCVCEWPHSKLKPKKTAQARAYWARRDGN